jgi:hypothetical protein
MFAGKAMSLPKSGATVGFTFKHYTWTERLAKDKHSSLFGPFVIGYMGRINKMFSTYLMDGPHKLVIVAGRPFRPSVMFAGKATLRGEPPLTLLANIALIQVQTL